VSSHTIILTITTAVIFGYPPSPDFNPNNFFLWDIPKEKVFPMRPANLMDLRATIIQLCSKITEDLYHNVITNIGVRFQEVIKQNGGFIEHVL
jgi:hypothetical protein